MHPMKLSPVLLLGLLLAVQTVSAADKPLARAESTPPAVLEFGGQGLMVNRHELVGKQSVLLRDVPIDADSSVDLDLVRLEVLEPNAIMEAASVLPGGSLARQFLDRPSIDMFHGTIVGEPDSHVFLALGERMTNGWIERDDQLHVITTHPEEGWTAIYDMASIDPADMNWANVRCAADELLQVEPDLPDNRVARGDLSCLALRIAVDTDWEFTGLFGGNTEAALEYVMTLFGAVSSVYDRDIGIALMVTYVRIWFDSNDPWNAGDSTNQLYQFQGHWSSQMDHVDRHLAHMLSGRNLGGGVAYLNGVCSSQGYAVSGNMNGSFPIPLEDNNGGNWDPMVVAHETGHNCGTGHTHDSYSPPIDGCGNGDCTDANLGTIMSYCHLCSGGMSNIVLAFHPQVQDVITNYLDTGIGCELAGDGSPPVAGVDIVQSLLGQTVDVPVLLNDYANDCSNVSLFDWDTTSVDGGLVELVNGDIEQAILRYTSPESSTDDGDVFHYEIIDGSGQHADGAVLVVLVSGREPDTPAATEPGSMVAYYDLDNPQVLPDFDTLEPYLVEVVSNVDYPSTGGEFAGSGLSDDFGAVFTGFIDVPETQSYTLYTDSDDGSKLYIGDELIVDNDGLHGMVEKSGSILLGAGLHAIRVEFFERGGGAGCIVRIEGGGLEKQVVPGSMWSHEVEVVGDVTGDGVVDVLDLLEVIIEWGPCPPGEPCLADLNMDGTVDVEDILIVLGAWG